MLTWQRHGCNKVLVLNRVLKSYQLLGLSRFRILNMFALAVWGLALSGFGLSGFRILNMLALAVWGLAVLGLAVFFGFLACWPSRFWA